MKRLLIAPVVVTAVLALGPATAFAGPPASGSCPGHGSLVSVDPTDPSYDPSSPAHRDRNADGWLCYNGHAWNDNRR